jgi:single-strand DNA-binding protein
MTKAALAPFLLEIGIEFVLGPFAELEVLARAKPKADAEPADAELPMEAAA